MENTNSYFKPLIKDGNLYLIFYPPQEGGKRLDAKEVMTYLANQGYNEYDIKGLGRGITSDVPVEIYIANYSGNPIHESISISLSLDYMLIRCTFYPPAEGGKTITMEDIQDALNHEKVVYGIDETRVQALLQNREYCTEYLIGKGTPPTLGKDAKIEYLFSVNQSLKPKQNEDGSVNYHELNIINRVEEGQLIARLIPAISGEPGRNVLGAELKPREVQNRRLSYANNIRISEDGTELYSEVTGHVSLVKDKVFVSGIYEVPADVDNSIGNINYPGNVHVKGNVKSGFVIHSDGDIIVDGVVEGAELYAGGQIIVQRGIHGMGKGLLSAKGNIIIKFIESATVKSGGYITTESIIQSQVSAKTEIDVSGGKGLIVGGVVRACNRIKARTYGSAIGAATHVEVGIEPEKMEHYAQLQKEAREIAKKIKEVRTVVINYSEKIQAGVELSAEKLRYMKSQVMELKELQEKFVPMNDEINSLRMEFMTAGRAKIEVQNVIHPGVTVKIAELSMTTQQERNYCQFMVVDGEIRTSNL